MKCSVQLLLLSALGLSQSARAAAPDYSREIKPLLAAQCVKCHGTSQQKGGLRLDHRAGVLQGGDSGPAITPGEPEKSRLARALSWDDPELQMPPKNRLPDAEIAVLTDWIRRGAPDPREATEAAERPAATRPHWAYQPLQPVARRRFKNQAWPANDLDGSFSRDWRRKALRPVGD
ncbi:MAG: hypothetical protein HC841_06530, partial [Verrucomicrobiae bacterium]|nr:hypothetical protein [Verrucomicrobiae bacterium]